MIRKLVTCTGSKTALWSLVFLLLTGLPTNLPAQTGETKGVVRDAAGQPVPNVNVMLKDGKSGTITDAKGAFALKDLPSAAVLVISGVGYETQEVALGGGEPSPSPCSRMRHLWMMSSLSVMVVSVK